MITRFRIKDHWAEQRMFMYRALAAGVVLLTLTLALAAKLVHLQVIRYNYYSDLSQGNRVRIEPVPPNRGLILDRNGEVLAENLPAYQLELTVEQLPTTAKGRPDIDGALKGLMNIGLIAEEDLPRLKRLIRSRRSFEGVPVRLQLTDEEVARFAVRRHYFQGIDIKTRLTRHYPMGELAVHALGYVGAISERDMARIDAGEYAGTTLIGKIGIEESYEQELHGTPGFRQVLVNAQGRPVERESALQADLSRKAAVSGNDLILGLDVRLQRVAEEALTGKRGAAIAIDPANGDVLAFVSKPGFDPHLFGRGLTVKEYRDLQDDIDVPLINRALRGQYPPGSTVKPMIAFAALHHHVYNPDQGWYCRGFYKMSGVSRPWRDWKPKGHGHVNLEMAIAQSCDTYFYQMGNLLGVDRLSGILREFGLGQSTGIDIGGEKSGILPSREWKQRAFSRPADRMWFPGDTINISIGQGYTLVTPMQLAQAVSIIASRGRAFKPRLVTAIRDTVTGTVAKRKPQTARAVEIGDTKEWERVVQGMVAVTTKGTGRGTFAGAKYTSGGKTGTAQVFSLAHNEKYNEAQLAERLHDHGLYIAFAPAENPKIALSVMVENGKHGTAAAKIARTIIDAWLLGEYTSAPAETAATANTPTVEDE